jgi:hypothetical protein
LRSHKKCLKISVDFDEKLLFRIILVETYQNIKMQNIKVQEEACLVFFFKLIIKVVDFFFLIAVMCVHVNMIFFSEPQATAFVT